MEQEIPSPEDRDSDEEDHLHQEETTDQTQKKKKKKKSKKDKKDKKDKKKKKRAEENEDEQDRRDIEHGDISRSWTLESYDEVEKEKGGGLVEDEEEVMRKRKRFSICPTSENMKFAEKIMKDYLVSALKKAKKKGYPIPNSPYSLEFDKEGQICLFYNASFFKQQIK